MNKCFVLVIVILFSFSSYADDSKHMITFGNSINLGWSGSAGTAIIDSNLGIKDFYVFSGNFAVNYAHRMSNRFQLGFYLSNENDMTVVQAQRGGSIRATSINFAIYGLVTYNFSDNLPDAFYMMAGIGKEYTRVSSSDTTGGSVHNSHSAWDSTGGVLQVGKRFNLKNAGIHNLSYSPSLEVRHGIIGGDLENGGVKSLTVVTLDLLKFDLLF